jgi:hypothetical protein
MKTFLEHVNEGAVIKAGKMTFKLEVFNDMSGLAIQAIPDKDTLKNTSKNDQVSAILDALKKKLPDFSKSLWFASGSGDPNLIFRIDTAGLADMIIKALK